MAKCECGRRMSKYAHRCKKCDAVRRAQLRAEYTKVLDAGKCPECGRQLKRNMAIAGWYQCEQFGADTHRADPSQPSCNYQFIMPEED